MDLSFEQKLTIEAAHVDCFGRCKASVLLYLAQEAAGAHCDSLSLSWEALAEKGLFWAVIRTHVRVERLPKLHEKVIVRTWPMPTTRTAFPRAVVICDEEGKPLVHVLSLWVLMDIKSRSMVLPGKSGIDVPGQLTGSEIAVPGSLIPFSGEKTVTRTVRFSELDRNGHMNNTYYLDWAADLLQAEFHKNHPVREFTICYLAEALENQTIQLTYGLDGDGIFQVDGSVSQTDGPDKKTRIFSVKMAF